jgi:hypothetical protein
LGGAVFEILRSYYGTDRIAFSFVSEEFNGVTRDNKANVRPLLTRRFSSLSQAEEEISATTTSQLMEKSVITVSLFVDTVEDK